MKWQTTISILLILLFMAPMTFVSAEGGGISNVGSHPEPEKRSFHRISNGEIQTINREITPVKTGKTTTRDFTLEEAKGIKAFHRFLTGEVQKVNRGLIFVKTQEGTTRSFSLQEAKEEGLPSLRKGDLLTLEVDEGNLIIDIHQVIRGVLDSFDPVDKKVAVRLDDGEMRTFKVKVPVLTKLNKIQHGAQVALEIDEEGRVMDVYGG